MNVGELTNIHTHKRTNTHTPWRCHYRTSACQWLRLWLRYLLKHEAVQLVST